MVPLVALASPKGNRTFSMDAMPQTPDRPSLSAETDLSQPTLAHVLRNRAQSQPKDVAFVAIDGKGKTTDTLNYKTLYQQVLSAATYLKDKAGLGRGDKAALLFDEDSSFDFVAVLLACLYSGIVAVPVDPLLFEDDMQRFFGIIADFSAGVVLANDTQAKLLAKMKRSDSVVIHSVDLNRKKGDETILCEPSSPALVTFRARSAKSPVKGVLVDQRAIVARCSAFAEKFGLNQSTLVVSALQTMDPVGLILNVCLPVFSSCPMSLIPLRRLNSSPSLLWTAASKLNGKSRLALHVV